MGCYNYETDFKNIQQNKNKDNIKNMESSDNGRSCDDINSIISPNLPFPEDLSKNVACFVLKKHTKFARIITKAEKDFSV